MVCKSCFERMEQLIEELTRDDLNVIPVPRDGKAILSAIEHYQPELTLCELFLPGYDAISILNQLKERNLQTPMIVSSPHTNSKLEEKTIQAGAVSYIIRPYTLESICSLIRTLLGIERTEEKTPICLSVYGGKILEIYKEIGMSPGSLGANYLTAAIEYAIDHPGEGLRGKIYTHLQEQFGVSPSRIERSMRYAIEAACDRGNYEALLSYFGAIIQAGRGKPTNLEFIATISNHIRFFGNCKQKSV